MLVTPSRTLGRHVEAALWVLIALGGDPLGLPAMFDAVRAFDGPIGHGTLMGAVSRLERLGLLELAVADSRQAMYRLTTLGREAGRSASTLNGRPA